jgi:alpha-glucosidase
MADVPIPASLVQDPFERNVPGFGMGRDPVRTPMPWTSEQHGGFTEGRPWLPLNADADVLNVSRQAEDPRSMLSLYRALIRLRRDNDVLSAGGFRLVAATDHVLAYERRLGNQRVLIALNMTDQAQILRAGKSVREALLSTYLDNPDLLTSEAIHLRADEGLILETLPDARDR